MHFSNHLVDHDKGRQISLNDDFAEEEEKCLRSFVRNSSSDQIISWKQDSETDLLVVYSVKAHLMSFEING